MTDEVYGIPGNIFMACIEIGYHTYPIVMKFREMRKEAFDEFESVKEHIDECRRELKRIIPEKPEIPDFAIYGSAEYQKYQAELDEYNLIFESDHAELYRQEIEYANERRDDLAVVTNIESSYCKLTSDEVLELLQVLEEKHKINFSVNFQTYIEIYSRRKRKEIDRMADGDDLLILKEKINLKQEINSMLDFLSKIDDSVGDFLKNNISYKEYLQEDHWQFIRKLALKRADFQCERCKTAINLNVHHITYENLNHEKPEDVIVLCENCHKTIHRFDAGGKQK